jgi:hypothetical protein
LANNNIHDNFSINQEPQEIFTLNNNSNLSFIKYEDNNIHEYSNLTEADKPNIFNDINFSDSKYFTNRNNNDKIPNAENTDILKNPLIIKINTSDLKIVETNKYLSKINSNENSNLFPNRLKSDEKKDRNLHNEIIQKSFGKLSDKYLCNRNENCKSIKKKESTQNIKLYDNRFTWVHLSCALWNSRIHINNFNKKEDFQSMSIKFFYILFI